MVEYQLVTAKGETLNTSEGFNGEGKANYPNGDSYDGPFVNGVSYILKLNSAAERGPNRYLHLRRCQANRGRR